MAYPEGDHSTGFCQGLLLLLFGGNVLRWPLGVALRRGRSCWQAKPSAAGPLWVCLCIFGPCVGGAGPLEKRGLQERLR